MQNNKKDKLNKKLFTLQKICKKLNLKEPRVEATDEIRIWSVKVFVGEV